MKKLQKYLVALVIFCLTVTVVGIISQPAEAMGAAPAETQQQPDQSSQEGDDPYNLAIVPLTTLDCGRCHESIFNTIRDTGGKHRKKCRSCHEIFHTYRPGTDWQKAVPNCTTCHGQFHGGAFLDCLSCHGNAHAPIDGLVNMDILAKNCASCHPSQAGEISQYPSAHSEVDCTECHHSRHGYLPNCIECHDTPHTAFVDNNGCVGCHPVHKPTEIHYSKETPTAACAGCHAETVKHLASTTKKHSNLQCAYCHSDTHGYIPECQKCHGLPHSKAMLDRFDGCLACHGDPHALVFPGE